VSLTVKPREDSTYRANLLVDDHVLLKFTVVGDTNSLVAFSLTFPNGTAKEFGNVGTLSYSFVCKDEGVYTLHFVNNDQSENKLVTLDCEVEHYLLGMPQMLFLAIIVVVVCVAMVAAYILMSRPM
jgi:Mg2+ and Co2+ transporter CorA